MNPSRPSFLKNLFIPRYNGLALFLMSLSLAGCASSHSADYRFVKEQSALTISGGVMGLHHSIPLEGTFRLTTNKLFGGAGFDSVNAQYPDLETKQADLNGLFNMTGLSGSRISDTEIEFHGHVNNPHSYGPWPVRLRLTILDDDRVHIEGGFPPDDTCCDFFFYQLDVLAERLP